ncbi:MAG: 3-deoxy-D-manno-octulosonic acid transferase [Kiritimatiellae bacterium]|nr:3-deoxy-D-manno-octulosonic acid transferase [Kiritimatiellia bacterium]
MKWCIYNLLFTLVYLAMMPSFLLRMKRRGGYKARMGDRFGRYPEDLVTPPRPVWIHAVSVGEVAVAGQLMRALRAQDPSIRFVFSTTSSTGWKQAEKELAPGDALIYNPLDFGGCVARALDRIAPRAVILTESEIWPTFIRALKRRGVPVYLINARVSDRSAPRYKALRWWFGEVLRCFTCIFAQSETDAQRLVAAGADPESVQVTGSFKFDVARRNEAKERELAEWIRSGESGTRGELLPGFVMPEADAESALLLPPILLGGSTWPGEDEAMLRVYREVSRLHPEVRLVLVPRHFEKADAVEANILQAGFACQRRSRGTRHAPAGARGAPTVYLGDTTGEMMGFFGLATVAFVGKSLYAHGSQNMIEPCLCGVPTVVGPYTENFRPVMSDLLAAKAIRQVKNEDGVRREVVRLFGDEEERKALGARARDAVARRCGVVARCAAALLDGERGFRAHPHIGSVASAKGGRLSPVAKLVIFLVLAAAYALTGWLVTPKLRHAWVYLQQNATRRYSTFLGLSAASLAMPWCLDDMRTAYIHLATRDYGFAKGKPYRVEEQNGHEVAYYRDEDYGGDVVTIDGWPSVTGEKFKATRLLADLIPYAEGAARVNAANAAEIASWATNRVFNAPVERRRINARLLSLARLKGVLEECQEEFGSFKLWCIGRHDYLVTPVCDVAADRLITLFDEPRTFSRFAEAGIYAPADIYACYLGTDREVLPALDHVPAYGPLRGLVTGTRLAFSPPPGGALEEVRPARITPLEPQRVAGLIPGGAEAELFAMLTNRIQALQLARRDVLRGLDAAAQGISSNALEHWSQAAKVNPRDPILKGLADSLDLEGRRRLRVGDANGALQCYENRIVVSPHDVAAIHNFGVCLKKAGRMELAARVFLKAVTMDPKTDEHRSEFVTCAAAAGKLGAATRQLEVLMAHNPDDPHLKLRAAKLLCQAKNELHNDARAIKLAEEAVTQTGWRDRALVQGLADVYIEAGRVMMGMGLKKRIKEMKFDR